MMHGQDILDALLNTYFRDHVRPGSTSTMNTAAGVALTADALDRIIWGVTTGYGGKDPDGPRRPYAPTSAREARVGYQWHSREDIALEAALGGEGQRRDPPCDVPYMALVLMRPEAEVQARWNQLRKDPLGRDGFGFRG